jgi:Ca-activated chloride channel family protein
MRGAVALAAASAASVGAAQAPPVFRAEIGYVYVDVFVSRGERPVPGLRAQDFALEDEGLPQSVEVASAESRPVQAVLVFDTSSSVAGPKLTALRGAGEAFLDGLRPADTAGLIGFSEEIALLADPTEDKAAVRRALRRLDAEGATAVYDALYAALCLSDPRTPSLVALFTDGDDNMSILGEREVRAAAERANAVVHVVGLRDPSTAAVGETLRTLTDIAEGSGGRLWRPESTERIRTAFAAIAASMGERYVLRYEPRGVPREGWHRLTVRLRGPQGTVRSRRGYWVEHPRTE